MIVKAIFSFAMAILALLSLGFFYLAIETLIGFGRKRVALFFVVVLVASATIYFLLP
jgi:hypothetical protein